MLLINLRSYKFILIIIGCIFVVQLFLALKLPSIFTSIVGPAPEEKQQQSLWSRKQIRDQGGGGSSLIDDEDISTKDKSGNSKSIFSSSSLFLHFDFYLRSPQAPQCDIQRIRNK